MGTTKKVQVCHLPSVDFLAGVHVVLSDDVRANALDGGHLRAQVFALDNVGAGERGLRPVSIVSIPSKAAIKVRVVLFNSTGRLQNSGSGCQFLLVLHSFEQGVGEYQRVSPYVYAFPNIDASELKYI